MQVSQRRRITEALKQKSQWFLQAGVLCLTILMTNVAFSNPVFNSVTSGNVSVTQTTNNTTVNQTSQQAILQWRSFDIGANQKTQFIQPNASSVTLNRITPGQQASQIYGTLTSNGQIILINAAGIHFGPGSTVNVGGIIASTSDISNANFASKKYIFNLPSSVLGNIVNEGTITASNYGLVALLGTNVTNNGLIQAALGSIVLGSGSTFTLGFSGDQLINFTVNQAASKGGKILNTGRLLADGGQVLVTASAAQNVLDNVIDMQGVAQANSVSQQNGVIILSASSGKVSVSGKLSAAGNATGTHGGTIKVLGQSVEITKTASLDASGNVGGGTVLVGGNLHGAGPEADSLYTAVDAGSVINASAVTLGNGGKVVVWSNNNTNFYGKILASGGANGGNGGFAEVSGHQLLTFKGTVNLTAHHGVTGSLLLDPEDLIIQNAGTTTAGSSNFTYTSNSDSSILTVTDLENALSFASVILQTGITGSQAGNITVANDVVWSNSNTLTLSAYNNINVNANITNTNAANLSLQADNTGKGSGTVNFGANGMINMSGGGTLSIYYNPVVFGTQDAAIANLDNTANTSHMNLDSFTTFLPYMLVNNVTQLQAIQNNLNGDYALGKTIDASATQTWNSGSGFTSLGNNSTAYSGNFDGQNYTINNFFSAQNGLFGALASTGVIQNVGLTNATVTLTNASTNNYGSSFGLLVGNNAGMVMNAFATGTISNTDTGGSEVFGGLVGTNSGVVQASYSTGNVNNQDHSGSEQFGGLVGVNNSMLQTVYSQSNVTNTETGGGTEVFGGLVGNNQSSGAVGATIFSGYSTGNVTNQDTHGNEVFGGVVGELSGFNSAISSASYIYSIGNVSNADHGGHETFGGGIGSSSYGSVNISYNTGNVINTDSQGASTFGGLIGSNNQFSTISNSYTTSNITNTEVAGGADQFGGFVGSNSGTILNAYTQGVMTNNDSGGNDIFGGFAGTNSGIGTIVNGSAIGNVINNDTNGNDQFGGLVGNNNSQVLNSFATNSVTNNDSHGFEFFGGLVGYNQGQVSASYALGNVSTADALGSEYFGGLVGYNSLTGSISNAYTAGTVSGVSSSQNVGGLAGYNDGAVFNSYSVSSLNVKASNVGGLIGFNDIDALVENVYSTGSVVSSGNIVGGLIGYNNGIVSDAFNSGAVTTSGNIVGGLIGTNDVYGQVYNTYNIGTVTGASTVGGLVGQNFGSIDTSYNSGHVIGTSQVGGFVGSDSGVINGSFFDADTSGVSVSGTTTGYVVAGCFSGTCQTAGALANLSDINTFSPSQVSGTVSNEGWDIVSTPSANGTKPANAWFIFEGQSRPVLTLEFSNVITDAHQLQLAAINPAASYTIANNLDMSGTSNPADIWGGVAGGGFVPIGTSAIPFTGEMLGQGAVLSGYYSSKGGIFGTVGTIAIVTNLNIVNGVINTTNTDSDYGLIAGANYGTIDTVSASGSVSANAASNVGGLIGYNDGLFTNATDTVNVSGGFNVGGVVGENDGSITNVSMTGNTHGANQVGGFVGLNIGSIVTGFDTGSVTGTGLQTGGLIGYNKGTVSSAYSTGTVSGQTMVGGLIGQNDGAVSDVYSSSNVSGFDQVGGLFGSDIAPSSSVTVAYATGSVTGNTNVGGFIGLLQAGTVGISYSTGSVTGSANVGGFIGAYNYNSQPVSVSNVYSFSPVTGGSNVGGLIGYFSGSGAVLSNVYSTGAVKGSSDVGGLLGYSSGVTVGGYWDTLTSGLTVGVGGGPSGQFGVSGQTTANMLTQNTFCASGTCSGGTSGYDFTANTGVWGVIPGSSYPYLVVFYPTFPRIVSGIANVASDNIVQLEVNGGVVPTQNNLSGGVLSTGSTYTGANGYYYFLESGSAIPDTNGSGNASLVVASLLNGNGVGVTTLPTTPGGSVSGLSIFTNTVSVGDGSVKNFLSNNFLSSVSSDPLLSSLYTVSGNNLTMKTGVGFATTPTTTFTANGNITTTGSTSSIDILGPLDLSTNAIFATGGNLILGGGVSGSAYTLTLTDNSVTGGNTFTLSNSVVLGNLVVNGSHNADTLSMMTTDGPIVWNILTPGTGNFSTVGLTGTFNNENTLHGSNYGDTFNVYSTIGHLIGGTTPNNLNTKNSSGTDTWNLTGLNSGSISGGATVGSFVNMQQLSGGATSDIFALTNAGGISGTLSAVNGTLNYNAYVGIVSLNVNTNQAPGIAGGYSGIKNYVGNGSTTSLLDTTGGSTWTITSNNAGSVASVGFSNIGNLVGGTNDTFKLNNAATVTSISGVTSTVDYTNFNAPVSVNVLTHTASNVSSFTGITQFIGDGANATMFDNGGGNTWQVNGVNQGTIAGISFSNFATLSGGAGDVFMMNPGASVTSAITASNATMNDANFNAAVTVNYGNKTASNVGSFSGVTQFIGDGANASFTDAVGGNVWQVNAANTGTVGGASFSSFANLNGGAADTFNMNVGGSVSGAITASAGTLSYNSLTSTVAVNLGTKVATNVGSFNGITNFVGDGQTATLSYLTGNNTWAVNSTNAGTVGSNTYSNFANLSGGASDTFMINHGGSETGAITASAGSVNYTNYNAAMSVNLTTNVATGIGSYSGITKFVGSGATGTMLDTSGGSVWQINAANAGTVAGASYSNFANLTGGAADTFNMNSGGSVSGAITASAGTLSYNSLTSAVAVNLGTKVATNVGSFSGITNFVGDGQTATLSYLTGNNTWAVNSTNAGTVGGDSYSNFANLAGGASDTFMINHGGSETGAITASAGSLNYTNYNAAMSLNLTTNVATGIGSYSGITQFVGSGATGTLLDTSGGNVWQINAANAGTVAGTSYSNFANLTGGAADTFNMNSGGSVSGAITASAGTLSYNSLTSAVAVNLGTKVATNVGSFSGITNFVGDGQTATLSYLTGNNTWAVNSTNAGTVGGDSYSNFANLAGGASDTFMINHGGSETGAITASAGSLNYTNYNAAMSVNLTTNVATGIGSYSGITKFVGSGATGTLLDTSGGNVWQISAANAGTVSGNNFSNFANLSGGSADTFNLGNGFGISGTLVATNATLNYSAYTTPVTINLGTSSATNVSTFSGVTTFVGNNNASSTIDGANTANTWNITGASAGNINSTINYTGFGNLVGGSGTNNFHFTTGGSEIFINGGSVGPDTLDYSAMTTPVNISLQAVGSLHGFTGTSSVGISTKFDNIDVAIGSTSASNVLTGISATTVWTITGLNAGNLVASGNTLNFSNFPNLAGGGGTNTISYLTGGSLTGSFTGGSGSGGNPADLIYNAPLTFTANLTLTTKGTGSIYFNGGVNWTGSYVLSLVSANKIVFDSPVSGVNGTLNLTAANTPQSITTNALGSINVKNFNLIQGQWYQVGSNLPAFNVSNNFQISSGVMPSTKAQFVRAAGGTGSSSSPYQIFDIYGLQGVGSSTAMLANSYVIINNISGTVTSNWNSGAGFVPLGNNTSPFVGNMNGQGFAVTNVLENRTAGSNEYDAVGLFGVTNGASISNLSLSGNFTGETNVGALVGTAKSTKLTSDVVVSGTKVTLLNDGDEDLDNSGVGGLVGQTVNATITSSSSAAAVVDQMWDSEAGGLVGYNVGGTISNSVASGSVVNGISTGDYGNNGGGGGSCGGSYGGNNYDNNNNNSGNNNAIGGLVGWNTGTITGSHSTATVTSIDNTSSSSFGGLVGYNANPGAISSSYSSGTVNAGNNGSNDNVGGLAGVNSGSISSSSNKGAVIVGTSSSQMNIGGLVGSASNSSKITGSTNSGNITLGDSGSRDNVNTLIGLNYGVSSSNINTGTLTILHSFGNNHNNNDDDDDNNNNWWWGR